MSEHEKPCDRWDARSHTSDSPHSATAGLSALTVTGRLDGARRLRDAYLGVGQQTLFGQVSTMPEKAFSHGIADELDRLLYLTLAVGIDYQRDAAALWRHAKERYDDAETRWLFRPREVASRTPADVLAALRRGDRRGTLRYPVKDSAWWHLNATTFAREFGGDPRVLFDSVGRDVLRIRREVNRPGRFQGLKGPKIFPLWMRMLVDVMGYSFVGYEALPIPVDIHVARATFTTGLVRGKYEGPFDATLIDFIRRAWTSSCKAAGESHMSFDESLWQLSRLGCTSRHTGGNADCPKRGECPIGNVCAVGAIQVSTQGVRIDT